MPTGCTKQTLHTLLAYAVFNEVCCILWPLGGNPRLRWTSSGWDQGARWALRAANYIPKVQFGGLRSAWDRIGVEIRVPFLREQGGEVCKLYLQTPRCAVRARLSLTEFFNHCINHCYASINPLRTAVPFWGQIASNSK